MITYNPFLGTLPVRKHDEFLGREGFVRSLFQSFINPSGIFNVAIIAELGHGKSSILNALFFKENREKYGFNEKNILVHMNFENYIGSIQDFYEMMYDKLYDSIMKNYYIDEDIKNSIEEYTGGKRIKRELEKVLNLMAENEFKTVFLLDNLDKAAKKTDFTVEEFSFLRSLSSGEAFYNVQYIITATKDLKDISSAAEVSGFVNIFVTQEVTAFDALFDQEEIEEYVETLFEKVHLEIDFNEICALEDISGGNPTILKHACNTLFSLKSTEEYEFNNEQFKVDVLAQCKNYFHLLWQNTSEYEKKTIYALAKDEDLDLDDYRVNDALRISCNRAIIFKDEDESRYKFVSEAFKLFVKEQGREIINFEKVLNTKEIISSNELEIISQLLDNKIDKINNKIENFESTMTKKMEDIEYSISIVNDIKDIMKEIGESKSEISDEDFDRYVALVGRKMDNIDSAQLPKSLEGTILNNIWNHLGEEQRINLIRGEHLNKMFRDANTDLSLVSYVYCKAAEQVLSEKVLPWVRRINPDHIIDNRKTTLKETDNLMIGQAAYILSNYKFKASIKNDCLSYGIDYKDFIKRVGTIQEIRNNSMHPGHIISRDELNNLRNYLFVEGNNIIETLFKITLV